MDSNNPPQSFELIASPEELKGRYSNFIAVTAQERDVVIDFGANININGKSNVQLVSRLFLNHFTARQLAEIIQQGLQKWENVRYENPTKYS